MLFEEDIKGNWMQSKNAVLRLNNKTGKKIIEFAAFSQKSLA